MSARSRCPADRVGAPGLGGLRALLRRRGAGAPSVAPGAAHQHGYRSGDPGAPGRWSLVSVHSEPANEDVVVDFRARALLRRYGVVFRRILTREPGMPAWRDLLRVYRSLEARGEIRGGRFVSGMSGEQFALPEAVERLREVRRTAPDDRFIVVSAADPLNLAGIITAGERVRALTSSRVLYRNGVPLAAMEGDYLS